MRSKLFPGLYIVFMTIMVAAFTLSLVGEGPRLSAPTGVSSVYDSYMEKVVNGTLVFIQGGPKLDVVGASNRRPRQSCLRAVKKGLFSGGVFRRYPGWSAAGTMGKILNDNKKTTRYVRSEYKFVQLDVKNIEDAPAYSFIVYGGRGFGHIELKVPASDLLKKGYVYALKSEGGKEVKVSLKELDFVYISDYIDAYPRNNPHSRIANKKIDDNGRPVKAVFILSKQDVPQSTTTVIAQLGGR